MLLNEFSNILLLFFIGLGMRFGLEDLWCYIFYNDNPEPITEPLTTPTTPTTPKIKFEDKYMEKWQQIKDKSIVFTDEENIQFINKQTELGEIFEKNKQKEIERLKLLVETLTNDLNQHFTHIKTDTDYDEKEENDCYYSDPETLKSTKSTLVETESLLEIAKQSSKCNEEIEKNARDFILEKREDNLINSVLIENTPIGNIAMRYNTKSTVECNNNSKVFEYFSDKQIPYKYLETIARHYVTNNNQCNYIFIDKAEPQYETKKKEDSAPIEQKKNVFAKFKKYAKTRQQQQPQIQPIIKTNRYVYKGKFSNLLFLKPVVKKATNITFAEYKAMLVKQVK